MRRINKSPTLQQRQSQDNGACAQAFCCWQNLRMITSTNSKVSEAAFDVTH